MAIFEFIGHEDTEAPEMDKSESVVTKVAGLILVPLAFVPGLIMSPVVILWWLFEIVREETERRKNDSRLS